MRLLFNARIYTLNPDLPIASAIAIDGGRLLAVGTDEAILAEFGGNRIGQAGVRSAASPLSCNMDGKAIIPGLTDAHIHLQQYALGLQKIDCETPSRAECLERVAERARNTPRGGWILGHGWNQNDWPEGFGTAADLDSIAPEHPVYLTAKSLHAAWANSAAFHLAGITAQTPDPDGGRLQHHENTSLTGILFETAMALVSQAIPEPTLSQIVQAIQAAQPRLWRMGLTGVHDFDRQPCFSALQVLHQRGELGLRVVKSIPIEALSHAVELGLRSGFGDDFLRIGSVKAFADGALGPRTAAVLQPYVGEPDNRGILMLDAEELFERGRLAVENGLSLAVHAIGDRANHEVLTAYAQLRELESKLGPSGSKTGGTVSHPPLRHRIEHVQIIHPDDAPRLAALDVIASMQPIHATSDFPAADRYWGEHAAHSYAWRTLLDFSTRMAYGSDAPVDSPNPFWGLHAAVTRRRQDGSPGPDGWYPAQRLSLNEALYGYTAGAAYAAGMENRLGRLAPGYLADLVVLDRDPFSCEVDEIRHIQPLATMVGGEWVYFNSPVSASVSSGAHPPPAP
ncbi:MAG TPA: amidohydrolase [Anaerolineales bacterium]|nr:amidohydrolase [Anaerolineales bacterium]